MGGRYRAAAHGSLHLCSVCGRESVGQVSRPRGEGGGRGQTMLRVGRSERKEKLHQVVIIVGVF